MSTFSVHRRFSALLILICVTAFGRLDAAAQELTSLVVTTTADNAGLDGQTSLREAIAYATTLNGPQTISFSSNTSGGAMNFHDGSPHTITVASRLEINRPISRGVLTIQGPGAKSLILSGGGVSRVLLITVGFVDLRGLTISNGLIPNGGAGIAITGTSSRINICECAVTNNVGTGIWSASPITITNSTISGNTAPSASPAGAGIDVRGPVTTTLTLMNSTISGNTSTLVAAGAAGGIRYASASGRAVIINSTITNNSGPPTGSGGIYKAATGPIYFANTILAGNLPLGLDTADAASASFGPSQFVSLGSNAFGYPSASSIINTNPETDLLLYPYPEEPLLAPLADNGGPTQTHKPRNSYWMVNTGNNFNAVNPTDLILGNGNDIPLLTDQRGLGFSRIVDGKVDIGAYEAQTVISITADAEQKAEGTGVGSTPFTFTITRVGDSTAEVSMDYEVAADQASDFGGTFPTGRVTIPAGQTTKTLTIDVSKDTELERDEIFTVILSNASLGTFSNEGARSTILNDDTLVFVGGSAQPWSYGQALTLLATVNTHDRTATGTVTFNVDGVPIATRPLVETASSLGEAQFTTDVLQPGNRIITATYSGDASYSPNTSLYELISVVNAATTSTTVASDVNPSVTGQTKTFTAKAVYLPPPTAPLPAKLALADGTPLIPAGSVTFKDGTTTLGTGTLNSAGEATLAVSSLAAGDHMITAIYDGEAKFLTSSSSSLAQAVNKAKTRTTVVTSATPTEPGQSAIFTATVSPVAPGAGIPTGNVAFYDSLKFLGAATLDGTGAAALNTSTLSNGSHSITALYSESADFLKSAAEAITQLVGPKTITITAGNNQSTTVGQPFANPLSVTVKDAAGTPLSGVTVTFAPPATGASGMFEGLGSAFLNGPPASGPAKGGNARGAALVPAGAPETGDGSGGGGTGIGNAGQPSTASGIATSSTFTANTISGTYTVSATVPGGAAPANFTLTNTPGAAATFSVSAPTTVVAGVPFNITVTAQDQYGNIATGYTGTVHFTSTDGVTVPSTSSEFGFFPGMVGSGDLPSNFTFTEADSGVHTFSAVTLLRADEQTLTVTDLTQQAITGTSNIITVVADIPWEITPASWALEITTVSTDFTQPLKATVRDKWHNPIIGALVNFAAPASGASCFFGATLSKTVSTDANGIATSGTITANATNGSYVVTATAVGVSVPAMFNLGNGTVNPSAVQIGTSGVLNRQSNLFELTVNVTNTTATALNGFRLNVDFSSYVATYPSLKLRNASSTAQAPTAYVNYPYPVAVGATVAMHLTFSTSNRLFPTPFNPGLSVTKLESSDTTQVNPAGVPVARIVQVGTGILLEWPATAGKWYRVSYSSGDMTHWYDSPTPLQASANKLQWLDNGAPFTISPPNTVPSRFYRVHEIPNP